jgi:hypothetical protein
MRNEILLGNLPLAIAILVVVCLWYRNGFRTPLALGIPTHATRRVIVWAGWILVFGITIRSIGGLFGDGRVAIARSGQMYAYRAREPMLFWGEIAGEMLMVGGTGAVLILLARRAARGADA